MEKMFCTDAIMVKIFSLLVSDFRKCIGLDYASTPLSLLLQKGIQAFRNYKFPGRSRTSPDLFKREYQLETFFKRYRFEHDVYTDDQLLEQAREKFLATQMRLDKGISDSPLVTRVLQRARKIAKEILGEYDISEHYKFCRFGKRACVGTQYKDAYLHRKLEHLTGSHDHIRWFKNYLQTDDLLRQAIVEASGRKRPFYEMCDTLIMSFVPKSFKSLRGICPDTLLGSFYTAGLGGYIQDRLAKFGLNIRILQRIHGDLAMRGSINRFLVTADLSAASDSITLGLLMRVLPIQWYRAVIFGRIPFVKLGDQRIRMNTVLTMGLGHTFPLQTLVFYSLIKAIAELNDVSGRVSVYGDDLIYPRSIHKYVKHIFGKLMLNMNEDKTYVQDFFRESCGSDFYHGCDVRPFSFEAEHYHCTGIDHEKLLYKLYNGLVRRWNPEEIAGTIEWIISELILVHGRVLYVPLDFPDFSGIRTSVFEHGYFHAELKPNGSYQSYNFQSIGEKAPLRKVTSQCIYYWESLRSSQNCDEMGPYDSIDDQPVLRWVLEKRKNKNGKVVSRVLVAKLPAKGGSKTYIQYTSLSCYSSLSHTGIAGKRCGPAPSSGCGYPTRNPVSWARRVGWRGWPLT